MLDGPARSCVTMLSTTYQSILDQIEDRGYDVFTNRARLSTARKLRLMAGSAAARWPR